LARAAWLRVALATLGVTLLVGIPAAYALYVRGGRLSRAIEEIITLPLAIPGLAIALALLLMSFFITFASMAMGTAIMALGQHEGDGNTPRGPRRPAVERLIRTIRR